MKLVFAMHDSLSTYIIQHFESGDTLFFDVLYYTKVTSTNDKNPTNRQDTHLMTVFFLHFRQ